METVLLQQTDVKAIASFLLAGEIVAFPTETVYGLAVLAENFEAYQALIECKNRPKEKAFPYVVARKDQIHDVAEVSDKQQRVIDAFLPGPLTMILPKKAGIPDYITAGQSSIAIRMSNDPFVLAILSELKKPILLTSANRSGEAASLTFETTKALFQGKIKAIVEGACILKTPTTIIDFCKEVPVVVRQGTLNLEEITPIWEGKIMKIAIGSDHAGYSTKEAIKQYLIRNGYTVDDVGSHTEESCNYSTYAIIAAEKVAHKEADRGILVCGSGIGMSIAANKVHGIRCALVGNEEIAKLSRQHNDSNVLAIAGRYTPLDQIMRIVDIWIHTEFEGGRHSSRIDIIREYEERSCEPDEGLGHSKSNR